MEPTVDVTPTTTAAVPADPAGRDTDDLARHDRAEMRSLALAVEHAVAADAPAPEPDDPYAIATAEFYDLLATGHWETFGTQLRGLLRGVDPAAGPIVDVGAGTGVGLPYLTAAVPAASIFAVEPSKAMRVALHARLTIDPVLRAGTTVDPRPFGAAELPSRASALVASAVLGHLSDDERARLWRYVADRLPPGAPAVVEVLPPERPITVPMTRYRELAVGDHTYEGWQAGVPADDRHMEWTMRYRVLHGEQVVAEHEAVSRWRCFSADDVRAEVARYRLDVAEHDDCVVLTHT